MGESSKSGLIKIINEFAAEILIARDRDPEIASLRAKANVIRLADELKICPGIVAGRFQHLTKKQNYFNGCGTHYILPLKWVKNGTYET